MGLRISLGIRLVAHECDGSRADHVTGNHVTGWRRSCSGRSPEVMDWGHDNVQLLRPEFFSLHSRHPSRKEEDFHLQDPKDLIKRNSLRPEGVNNI